MKPEIVDIPEQEFLMVDGHGDPDGPGYPEAVAGLYKPAYALRFALKKAGVERKVAPLEGRWWADDLAVFAAGGDRSHWKWTLMIGLPPEAAGLAVPLPDGVRRERFAEGLSAQALHIGPYATEPETLDVLHAFITEQGYAISGDHHEIYLSDPRRAKPERLKTILRYPISPRR
ncbi:GyrI-like domain-containing protein [Hamadaea sp. NPDC050747]|uniref:GyrI-like domain-containing protein n=1 Tax=Hamadaea sp. NPDC050747 TaxID=3155789 RepID=UPI0033C0AF05